MGKKPYFRKIRSYYSMSNVDEHIWAEILTRLPSKAVGRVRCVCKALNSLISSSFLSKHLSFLAHNNEPSLPICYILFDLAPQWCEVINFSFYNPEELNAPTFSSFPFGDANDRFMWNPVGVIHGVVCIARENKSKKPFTTAGSPILWNPTIGKHLFLPDGQSVGWRVIGFGFDNRTDDFKVVRVLGDHPESDCQRIYEVFSSLRGCWRRLASSHILGGGSNNFLLTFSSFVNGCIHWVAREKPASGYGLGMAVLLVVFDCREEELKTMELPVGLHKSIIFGLGNKGGVLSVWAMDYSQGTREVWEMQEHGVADSWKELTTWQARNFVTIDRVNGRVEANSHHWIQRLAQPMKGGLFQPSLFLLDNPDAVDDKLEV